MQSYNPGLLGWGFLRLLLRLQLRSLSRGVPSSHLEKDEILTLGHTSIYSWKCHALCYAGFGFASNRWINTLSEQLGKPNTFDWHVYTANCKGGVTRLGGLPVLPGRLTRSARVTICRVNVSRWGNPPNRGRVHGKKLKSETCTC